MDAATDIVDLGIFLDSLLKEPWSSPALVPRLRGDGDGGADGARLLLAKLADEKWDTLETPIKLRVLIAFLLLPPEVHAIDGCALALRALRAAEEDRGNDWVQIIAGIVRERLGLEARGGNTLADETFFDAKLRRTVELLRPANVSGDGSNVTVGTGGAALSIPYAQPLELAYLSKRDQPPKRLFRNVHFTVNVSAGGHKTGVGAGGIATVGTHAGVGASSAGPGGARKPPSLAAPRSGGGALGAGRARGGSANASFAARAGGGAGPLAARSFSAPRPQPVSQMSRLGSSGGRGASSTAAASRRQRGGGIKMLDTSEVSKATTATSASKRAIEESAATASAPVNSFDPLAPPAKRAAVAPPPAQQQPTPREVDNRPAWMTREAGEAKQRTQLPPQQQSPTDPAVPPKASAWSVATGVDSMTAAAVPEAVVATFGDKVNQLTVDECERLARFIDKQPHTAVDGDAAPKAVRIKLNEEVVEEAGGHVRESLYVVLEYSNYTWRKTRKRKGLKGD